MNEPKTYIIRVPCEFWFAAIVRAQSEEQAVIIANERAKAAGWAVNKDMAPYIETQEKGD